MSNFLQYIGTPFQRYILPIIPAGAKLAKNSKIRPEQFGKIPGEWAPGPRVWYKLSGWQRHQTTKFDLQKWQGWQARDQANTDITIGARTGELLVCAELKVNDPRVADEIEMLARRCLGPPLAVSLLEGSNRRLLVYLHDPRKPQIETSSMQFTLPRTGETVHQVEILGKGQLAVLEGPAALGE